MSLDNVKPGKKIPESFNVIIEIPMNADPIKYEVDKESGAIFVDRFMGTAMHYPCNYGYINKTIAGDGDPVDVLVITPFPLIPGVVVSCRAIGLLKMEDEAGQDTENFESLSMVLLDTDFNGNEFDMDECYFADDLLPKKKKKSDDDAKQDLKEELKQTNITLQENLSLQIKKTEY